MVLRRFKGIFPTLYLDKRGKGALRRKGSETELTSCVLI